jgi:hypothetical protein
MTQDISTGRLARNQQDVESLVRQGLDRSVADDLAMDAFSQILQNSNAKKGLQAGNKVSPEEIDKVMSSVFHNYNRRIAQNYYKVDTDPQGQDWVEFQGGRFKVLNYEYGSPVVNIKELKESDAQANR